MCATLNSNNGRYIANRTGPVMQRADQSGCSVFAGLALPEPCYSPARGLIRVARYRSEDLESPNRVDDYLGDNMAKTWNESGHLLSVTVLTAGALLAACGGGGGGSSAPAQTVTTLSCEQLPNRQIAASNIGLPTNGAVVVSAQRIAASGVGTGALAEHCLVVGNIAPVDPNAPKIVFRVALPTVWNSKAVMLGGGGFDGTIPNVEGNILNAAPSASSPLARGYAVFGSDSGHQSMAAVTTTDGAFMTNAEAYRNWAGDALKKTRDAAMDIVKASYGTAPQKSYFLGQSTGGKEALIAVGRWPADWDGIVSLYPARLVVSTGLGLLNATQALAQPGAYLNFAKRAVLRARRFCVCHDDNIVQTAHQRTPLLHGRLHLRSRSCARMRRVK